MVENKASTAGLLLETDRLQKSLQTSNNKSRLLQEFLHQYQLSAAESDALQSDTITDTFFKALEHVQSIHTNCKSLLRTHHQRAGLELLDTMTAYQESAYEKLCRWVQAECRTFSDVDFPEATPLLQQAVKALAARPVLHKYCAEEVATARQTALFQRFIGALTRGPRPIEMLAPDPWRFASDMLAWVHTAMASEREFLVSLFGVDDIADESTGASTTRMDHTITSGSSDTVDALSGRLDAAAVMGSDESMTLLTTTGGAILSSMLGTIVEGICRPLRMRIEQILMASPSPLLCFKLSQLLSFYLYTIDGILGFSSQLSDTLRACRAMAMRTFHEHLKHKGEKLGRFPPPPPPDLSLPVQLAEGAVLAEEVIKSYEGSLNAQVSSEQNKHSGQQQISSTGAAIDDPLDMDDVISAIIKPLVAAAEHSAEALDPKAIARLDDGSHLDPSAQKVYMINCLHALQRPLQGHQCAFRQVEMLGKTAQGELEMLASLEARRILSGSGLDRLAAQIQSNKEGSDALAGKAGAATAASNEPRLPLETLARVMQTFFGSLTDPSALPEFRKLQVPVLKAEAVRRSLNALAEAYECVYDHVYAESSGYDRARVMQMIRHTPGQVRTLLGVS